MPRRKIKSVRRKKSVRKLGSARRLTSRGTRLCYRACDTYLKRMMIDRTHHVPIEDACYITASINMHIACVTNIQKLWVLDEMRFKKVGTDKKSIIKAVENNFNQIKEKYTARVGTPGITYHNNGPDWVARWNDETQFFMYVDGQQSVHVSDDVLLPSKSTTWEQKSYNDIPNVMKFLGGSVTTFFGVLTVTFGYSNLVHMVINPIGGTLFLNENHVTGGIFVGYFHQTSNHSVMYPPDTIIDSPGTIVKVYLRVPSQY